LEKSKPQITRHFITHIYNLFILLRIPIFNLKNQFLFLELDDFKNKQSNRNGEILSRSGRRPRIRICICITVTFNASARPRTDFILEEDIFTRAKNDPFIAFIARLALSE